MFDFLVGGLGIRVHLSRSTNSVFGVLSKEEGRKGSGSRSGRPKYKGYV